MLLTLVLKKINDAINGRKRSMPNPLSCLLPYKATLGLLFWHRLHLSPSHVVTLAIAPLPATVAAMVKPTVVALVFLPERSPVPNFSSFILEAQSTYQEAPCRQSESEYVPQAHRIKLFHRSWIPPLPRQDDRIQVR